MVNNNDWLLHKKEMISIVIPTYKGREKKLKELTDSIYGGHEIIIVDGDKSLAAKRNEGASRATKDILLFVDDDNVFCTNTLKNIKFIFKTFDGIGVLGCVGTYASNTTKVCDGGSKRNFITGFTSDAWVNKSVIDMPEFVEVDEVANAFAIRREVFEELGGLDEESFPIDLDEADLCARVKRRGLAVFVASKCIVFHKSNTYSRLPDFRRLKNAYYLGRNKILFQKKHGHNFGLYLLLFLPVTILGYSIILCGRGKLFHLYYFIKGVVHGIRGIKGDSFQ